MAVGLLSRLRAQVGALLAPAEDPRRAAPSEDARQAAPLERLRAALVEVAASRQQLTAHLGRLQDALPGLESQARAALAAGREDLARLALEHWQAAALELQRLEGQAAAVAEEEQTLLLAEHQLAARVDAFRARQDVVSARYTAAEAQVRLNEALAGVSQDLSALGSALERTEANTQRLRARAATLDELIEAGLLPDAATLPDALEPQLVQLNAGRAVDAQLAALKAQMGPAGTLAPLALERPLIEQPAVQAPKESDHVGH
jgi:phage shock protein A